MRPVKKINISKLGALLQKSAPYILIVFYVAALTWQINSRPFERYPDWDRFWIDTRTAGVLMTLKHALTNLELPLIDPYTNFGWDLAGNHHSFFGITNLFILITPPAVVIILTQALLLILGAVSAFLFLKRITQNHLLSVLGGISYISLPYVISLHYYEASSFAYYCVPLFLLLIHRFIEQTSGKRLLAFAVFVMIAVGLGDIYALITFSATIFVYTFLISWRYYHLSLIASLKKSLLLILLFILASAFFTLPLYENLASMAQGIKEIKAAGVLASSYSAPTVNFFDAFRQLGLKSLYRPFEGSGLLLYAPPFFYISILTVVIFKRRLFKDKPQQFSIIYTLVFLAVFMFLISLVFYSQTFMKLFPGLREGARGVLRIQLNLIPFVILLAGFISLGAINRLKNHRQKINLYVSIILVSLLIDQVPQMRLFSQSLHRLKVFAVKLLPHLSPVTFSTIKNLLVPFVLIAGFVCLIVIYRLKNTRKKINLCFLIIVLAWLINLILFIVKAPILKQNFGSSNRLSLHLKNAVYVLPWFSLMWLGLIAGYNFLHQPLKLKKIIYAILIGLTVIIPWLNISVYNEILAYTYSTRHPYLWRSYLQRRDCLDQLINRYDKNYRTLYTAKGKLRPTRGADWKLIAETELHTEKQEKILFPYREFMHPYTGLMHGIFKPGGQGFEKSNTFPPLSQEVTANLDTVKLMGIKWIISANSPIESPELIYRGRCNTEDGPLSRLKGDHQEGGPVFVYELTQPLSIAFLVDDYVKLNIPQSLRVIYENQKHPWQDNLVYLETEPDQLINLMPQETENSSSLSLNQALITKETYNSIEIQTNASKEKFLVVSYLYRPGWHAYLNSSPLKIYRAYGGFMAVKIPPGHHLIEFKYFPIKVYLGFALTGLTLLILLILTIKNKKIC